MFSLLEDLPSPVALIPIEGETEELEVKIPTVIRTGRLINYSKLYNDKTKEILKLDEISQESNKKHDLDHLYYLK